ncbi:SDR family oxidoreductase [Enteractinococcus helveticum]|uniref:NADH(P)-binding protein n=1 Tax=Enteractinococcus helveticum TaxID=1837282 RepID=A0A1B7LXH6_9MICC|nr:NADH(P)-binding protein [Enteractinococcus helveticum]OAV59877.1 NADH(P)-binding protein [Enteractinococcus helveticum]
MRVAVVGGGISGKAIKQALLDRGATAELLSRSTGFDVLQDNATLRLAGFDVVIEATGRFTTSRKTATEFFTRSTRALAAAAQHHGAHHILLSIVNCERPEVQGYGYFAGKAAQERVARSESDKLTIIRSTQWFEFAAQNLVRLKVGPVSLVPQMTIQPVALEAVAEVIADVAVGGRIGDSVELAGPETMTLWDMTKQLPTRRQVILPLPMPGKLGRAFRKGICVPGPQAQRIGPLYSRWLAEHAPPTA